MNRAVNKFALMPIFNPSCIFNVIIQGTLSLFKQRFIHVAFGGGYDQFELLISEVVGPLIGMVMVNVVVEVLSEPKSNTATDLLPLLAL